ncbi:MULTISPECIES: hypothetical protein [Halolamina]|uniref:Uncharacterized protein n=1 Tax=Halolamina pelagica TaxID=699431 RepID=A0A1I5U8W7_9EURY|nr:MULTISPECIES: hypothetical protein [Halolamina]SFP91723.1 hypothetical protein SAMN05216277_11210 [Halolamina pelagica]
MAREQVLTYEQRQTNYDRVALAFDGEDHELVERVDGDYEPVDE